jgi:DNA-directed RNA polymerase specialized sigma24 family protein
VSVSLQLAMQLQKLRHLTASQAAERLGIPVAEVEKACRMLALPMSHEPEPPLRGPDDAEHTADRVKWPMKKQQRYEKAKR